MAILENRDEKRLFLPLFFDLDLPHHSDVSKPIVDKERQCDDSDRESRVGNHVERFHPVCALASNETQDQQPREREMTFACSQSWT